MPFLHHSNQAVRPTLGRRLRGYSSAAGVLAAASLAITACGTSNSTANSRSAHVLNTAKVAGAIQQSALAQRGKHVRVTCPLGIAQTKGVVFQCTAYYGHSSTPFAVTEVNGLGDVHYVAG